MPWLRLDIHWYQDEKIEAAADDAGPLVLALYPVLLAKAKAQANAGKVEFTYRALTTELFASREEIDAAIDALVSASVLTCPQASDKDATVAFKPESWRRYSEVERKTAKRDGES